MRPRSIRARLLLWSGALTVGALIGTWAVLSPLLAGFVERRLQAELRAVARGLMAAVEWDDNEVATMRLVAPPSDPRFETPLSGWYWQVSDGATVLRRAPALLSGDLGPAATAMTGPDGAALLTHRETFTAPGDPRTLTVIVTMPAAEAAAELAVIRRPLGVALTALGLILILAQLAAVRAGLVDLTRFARAIADLRAGRRDRLPPPRVAELDPLAAELDRLIAAIKAHVEHARAAAGDLAHALKTPLAVLANRAGPEDRALVERMERTIRWHLQRARAAALAADPSARAGVDRMLDELTLVLGPEAQRRGLALEVAAERAPDFRGDPEDLTEMVGALAENAVKWARRRVRITARGDRGRLIVEIDDDGPGIPETDRGRLTARGVRLDETTAGHGLGLAIAADRAQAYGGTLTLDTADLGGLRARLDLPAAAS
jgi:signal transduction histidine kinase